MNEAFPHRIDSWEIQRTHRSSSHSFLGAAPWQMRLIGSHQVKWEIRHNIAFIRTAYHRLYTLFLLRSSESIYRIYSVSVGLSERAAPCARSNASVSTRLRTAPHPTATAIHSPTRLMPDRYGRVNTVHLYILPIFILFRLFNIYDRCKTIGGPFPSVPTVTIKLIIMLFYHFDELRLSNSKFLTSLTIELLSVN